MVGKASISLILIALTLPASWAIFVGKNGFYEGLSVVRVGNSLVGAVSFSELEDDSLEEGTLLLTVDSSGGVSGSYKIDGVKLTSMLDKDGKVAILGYLAESEGRRGILLTWNPGDDRVRGLIIRNSSVTHSMAEVGGETVLVGSVEISGIWSPLILRMRGGEVEKAFTIPGSIEAYDSTVKGDSIALAGFSYSPPGMTIILLRGSSIVWSEEIRLKGARLEPNSISFGSSSDEIAVAGTAWMGSPKRSDGFIAILDGDGTLLDFLLVGGQGGNQFYEVKWDPFEREFVAVGMGGCFIEGGCDALMVRVAPEGDHVTGMRLGTTKVEKAESILPLKSSYIIAGTSEGEVTRSLFYGMFMRISRDGKGCLPKREFDLAVRHEKPELEDLKVTLKEINLITEAENLKVERARSLEIWNPCSLDPYFLRGIAVLIFVVAVIFVAMALLSKKFITQRE